MILKRALRLYSFAIVLGFFLLWTPPSRNVFVIRNLQLIMPSQHFALESQVRVASLVLQLAVDFLLQVFQCPDGVSCPGSSLRCPDLDENLKDFLLVFLLFPTVSPFPLHLNPSILIFLWSFYDFLIGDLTLHGMGSYISQGVPVVLTSISSSCISGTKTV